MPLKRIRTQRQCMHGKNLKEASNINHTKGIIIEKIMME
jgi:hypothetical protein